MPTNIVKPLQWYDWNRDDPLADAILYAPFWRGMGPEAMDVSGNQGDLTLNNNPLWIGEGISYDGSSNQNCSSESPPVVAPPFTFSCMFRARSAGLRVLMTIGDKDSATEYFLLGLRDISGQKVWYRRYATPSFYDAYSSNTYTLNKWHIATATIPASGTGVIYLDAVGNSGADTRGVTGADMLRLGLEVQGSLWDFDGDMAWAAIWDRDLSASEVVSLNARPYAPITRSSNLSLLTAGIGAPAAGGFIPYPHPLIDNMYGGVAEGGVAA